MTCVLYLPPMKGILSSTGSSIVNVRLGCRSFKVVRNIVAASVFGILARVSSKYLQALACEFLLEEAREDGRH